ncbi:BrnT family toxin [Pararhizobium sp. DWP3-4]|uniref:BrnT family toxin n=1 Tax=Pararhizobium sp. DWP3-4 TaxID=2804565 RepID=UPI003CE96A25
MMLDPQPLTSFDWNDQKRLDNIRKHGIDFEDAILALQASRIEFQSIRNGEVRTLAICPDTNRIITVVYTMRAEICRIISARPAHKNEQRIYYQSFPR